MEIFSRIPEVNSDRAIIAPEISVADMRKQNTLDMQDMLDRVDCLNLLGYPVIVSNYLRYFRLRDFIGRYTRKKVAFVMGIPNLETLFNEAYYDGLAGGILGAFASLFDRETLLFVYPMRSEDHPNEIITTENFPVPEDVKHLYEYLRANNKIIPVEKYNDANMHIWPDDVLQLILKGPGDWEKYVPEPVAKLIGNRCMFGFCSIP